MNILIALIPAIGWGIQPLILKKIGGRPVNEILGTGIGTLLVGLVVYFFFTDQSLSLGTFMLAMASGAFWVIGQTGQYMAFNLLGVSRTMPISTGLQLVGTSLIGMLLFNEWAGTTSRIIGFGAIILLIIGAALTAVTEDSSNKSGLKQRADHLGNHKRWVLGIQRTAKISRCLWRGDLLPANAGRIRSGIDLRSLQTANSAEK